MRQTLSPQGRREPGLLNTLHTSTIEAALEQVYRSAITIDEAIHGGDSAAVYRARLDETEIVIRVTPEWVGAAEIAWTHKLMHFAAGEIAEVLAPLPTPDGSTLVETAGRVVTVYPFIESAPMDDGDAAEVERAGELLGRLHRVLRRWTDRPERPPFSPDNRFRLTLDTWPEASRDSVLDAWLAEARADLQAWIIPIHGDFYSRNLLVDAGGAIHLIDWDEARIESAHRELAFATWEFANERHTGGLFSIERAARFLRGYMAGGPEVPLADLGFLFPLMREHIRFEVGRALAWEAKSGWLEADERIYIESQAAAFAALGEQSADLLDSLRAALA